MYPWAVMAHLNDKAWAEWAEKFARGVCRKCGGINFRMQSVLGEQFLKRQHVWRVGGLSVCLELSSAGTRTTTENGAFAEWSPGGDSPDAIAAEITAWFLDAVKEKAVDPNP